MNILYSLLVAKSVFNSGRIPVSKVLTRSENNEEIDINFTTLDPFTD